MRSLRWLPQVRRRSFYILIFSLCSNTIICREILRSNNPHLRTTIPLSKPLNCDQYPCCQNLASQTKKLQRNVEPVAVDGCVEEAHEDGQLFVYRVDSCVCLLHRRGCEPGENGAGFRLNLEEGKEAVGIWEAPKRPEAPC